MDTQNNKQLVFQDSAVMMRAAGAIFAAASLAFFMAKMPMPGLAFVVAGLGLVLFSSNLTITADRSARTLRLEYRFLLFRSVKEIPFDDIDEITLQYHHSSSHGRSSEGYRIAATLKDGKTIPFRLFYSGKEEKARQVTQLCSFIRRSDTRYTPAARSKAAPQTAADGSSGLTDEATGTGEVPSAEIDEPGTDPGKPLPE